jgi:hypothetical protein
MDSIENQETVHKELQNLIQPKENQYCFDCSTKILASQFFFSNI